MADQRVAVVTGASSGVGKSAAAGLLRQGWRVIGLGRDPTRSAGALADLTAAAKDGGGSFEMVQADLALLADAARAARDIAARTDRIDVLLNNAGGVASAKRMTAEGNEATFSGNHLGHFLLTNRLLPLLRTAAADAPAGAVRIVNTSSNASEMIGPFNWDDLQMDKGDFIAGRAYCNAKLANVVHARGLADRLAADGIVAHSFHPGVVASNFASHADSGMQAYMATLDAITPDSASDALVWLATSDEAGQGSGRYWHGTTPMPPNPCAEDAAVVDRLWDESEKLVAKAAF